MKGRTNLEMEVDGSIDEQAASVAQDDLGRKVDYVYKRCYVDLHGNLIDPRTPWDILLKYYKHNQRVLVDYEGNHGESVDHKARREARAERIQEQEKSRTSSMESCDLEDMGKDRKASARRRTEQLATQYM